MNTLPCRRCGYPVLVEKADGEEVAWEASVNFDDLFAEVSWVLHDEDRCEFAAIVAASFT